MPILENYRHYFDIDPDYFPAVNEAVINSKPDMWKKFFPHETFVKLLKNTVSVLDRKQKLSIWVEGAYGTGKSHAVLTEKKLLDASEEDTREYFERYHLDMDLYKNLQRIKNSGKILTVHRYGSSNIYGDNDLVLAIQESVEKAMAAAGIVDALVDFSDDAYVRHTEAVKRIATAYLKLLFPNVRTASDVNPKEFMKYCLRPAIKMRKIIWRQLSILDAEYKNDDKLMPEFTLKEIRNEA